MRSLKSEAALISLLERKFRASGKNIGIGDDCAAFEKDQRTYFLVTLDGVREGIHFFRGDPAGSVMEKLFVRNISDVLVKGGEARFGFIYASVRKRNLPGYMKMMEKYAGKFGIEILGGDTNISGTDDLSMTLIGTVEKKFFYSRHGARPGDLLYLSGPTGFAACGLNAFKMKDEDFPSLLKRYLNYRLPSPGFLRKFRNNPSITSSIDISDGLLMDAGRLASSSGIRLSLTRSMIPVDNDIRKFCNSKGIDPFGPVLNGGDDYSFLFTSRAEVPFGIMIGKAENGTGVRLNGKKVSGGYDHFKR